MKVMISMPEDLLKRVDEQAEKEGASRSGLIREALWRYLAEPVDLDRRRAAYDRILSRRATKRPWDLPVEELLREDRDHGH